MTDLLDRRLPLRRPLEEGWPAQRLRIAFGAFLFVIFELTLGKKLPLIMVWTMLGLGIASMFSAHKAIQRWKLESQIRLLQEALDHRP
jgi:hypothetical protein